MMDNENPLTPERVLADIQRELKQPLSSSPDFQTELNTLREANQNLRFHPVIGSLKPLKHIIYRLNHFIFSRIFIFNDTLIRSLMGLHNEINDLRSLLAYQRQNSDKID